MKYKLKKSLLALLIAPMATVFMANSAYPEPEATTYRDFSFEIVDSSDYTNSCKYILNITNTGDLYAHARYVKYSDESFYFETYTQGDTYIFKQGYYDPIAPGTSRMVSITCNGYSTSQIDETDFRINGEAYSEVVEGVTAEYKGMELVNTSNYNYYKYKIKFDLDFKEEKYKYTFLAYTLNYDGKSYGMCDHYAKPGENEFILNLQTEIDVDQVTITNITLLRGKEEKLSAIGVLVVGIILIGLAIALVGLLVIPGIVLLIVFLVKRHNRKEREEFENY